MFGLLAMDFGYTPAQVWAMTLPEIQRLFKFASKNPSARLMIAAYLGIKPEDDKPKEYMDAASAKRVAAALNGAGLQRA